MNEQTIIVYTDPRLSNLDLLLQPLPVQINRLHFTVNHSMDNLSELLMISMKLQTTSVDTRYSE